MSAQMEAAASPLPARGSRLRVCQEPMDTSRVRWLLQCNDPAFGRVVLRGRLGHRRAATASVLADLLDALGATGPQRALGRTHPNLMAHVLPRMLAHDLEDLIVHDYRLLPVHALEHLIDLSDAVGARLWLTGPAAGTTTAGLLHDRAASAATWAELQAALIAPTAGADTAAWSPEPWPVMPADDFPTFRAAMKRVLRPEEFDNADALYLDTLTESQRALAGPFSGQGTLHPRQPTGDRPVLHRGDLEAAVAAHLHTLVACSGSLAEITVRVRAAQVAAFTLGWLLQVKLERLLATASSPSEQVAADPRTWATFGLYREPHIGAVLVLAALGMDATTIRTLPAHAVSADGCSVTLHGATLPVPPGGALLMRAQQAAGQLAGRAATEPFVHAHDEELTNREVFKVIRTAYLDTGLPLLSRRLDAH